MNRKEMVYGAYILSNLFDNSTNYNIDLMFSSIPMLKKDINTKFSYIYMVKLQDYLCIWQKYLVKMMLKNC